MTHLIRITLQLFLFVIEEILCSESVKRPQINIPTENFFVQFGRRVLLECHVQGATPINVTWTKKGIHIKENKNYDLKTISGEENINTYQLWISVIDSEVFGDYTCIASNLYGRQKRKITLREDKSSSRESQPIKTKNGGNQNGIAKQMIITAAASILLIFVF